MKYILCAVSLFLSSSLANAHSAGAGCSGKWCLAKVSNLYPHSDANVVHIGTDGDESQLSCIPGEGGFIMLFPDQPLFAQIYATLLEAVTHDKLVHLRVNTDGGACRLIYVEYFPGDSHG